MRKKRRRRKRRRRRRTKSKRRKRRKRRKAAGAPEAIDWNGPEEFTQQHTNESLLRYITRISYSRSHIEAPKEHYLK